MSRSKKDEEKKRKKEQSILEAQFFAFIQSTLKAAVDAAMKEIFKDIQ